MAWAVSQRNNVMNQFIQGGLSPYGAAALTARWAVIENPGGDPSIFGGYKGRAFGHAQWLEPRRGAFWSWADENGLNPNSENVQVQFALHELNTTESRAGKFLKTATNARDGAIGASIFERAGGYNPKTGFDDYTVRTERATAGIKSEYDNSAALSELRRQGIAEYGNEGDDTIPLDQVPEDYFKDAPGNIETAIEEGDPGKAGEEIRKAGKLKENEPGRSSAGSSSVPKAIDEQSKQMQLNTDAIIKASAESTKAAVNTASGVATGFQTLLSNLFIRGALVMLGAIFILAGVYGLALNNNPLQQLAKIPKG